MKSRLMSCLSKAGFVCLLAALPALHAQINTANITGTVSDATGAVIPDTELILTNVETGIESHGASNSVGNYRFSNLQPGTYTLQAGKEGFTTAVIQPFTLNVGQEPTFNFSLEVGAVAETVTVEASGAELQASSAELGTAVTERQVVDLPLNGRNFTQLLALTPGVAPVSVSQNAGGFSARPVGQFQFPAINGQNNRSNLFMLDGVNNQGQFVSTYAVPPIVDAIQEFKVNSHDQATFGGALGGVINVVSKGGTNEMHGTAWEFLRNDSLDARNFFRADVTPLKINQFGATLGGPIAKNKTFFFIGYQGYRLRTPADSLYRVPTSANLAGDLSDEPRQIYDPFSTREDPVTAGQFIRDPFINNQIPGAMLSPGSLAFATTLPSPIVTGVSVNNALDTTPRRNNQEEYTARLDHVFSEQDSAWFRWSGTVQDNTTSGGRQAISRFEELRAINVAGSWVHTFSPTTILQMSGGVARSEDNAGNRFNAVGDGFADQIGCSTVQWCGGFNSGTVLIPNWNVAGYFSGGENNTLNVPSSKIWNLRGDMTKIVGNHTIRFGGDGNTSNFQAFYENVNNNFRIQQTALPGTDTGSPLASFLLGVPDTGSRRNVHETLRPGGVMGWYIHDTWRVNSKLTINIGLRYDRTFQPPYGKEDTIGQQGGIETGALDLSRGIYIIQRLPPSCNERGFAPCIPGDGTLPEHVQVDPRGKIYHDTKKNFQPRFGFAYRAMENTVVRGSFGVFFENWAAVTQTAQNYEASWPDIGQQIANNMNVPTAASPTPNRTAGNPFAAQGLFPPATPFEGVLWYMDPFFENPYSLQWNFGVQHQFDQATLLTANWVGSHSSRLNIGGYYNTALTPGPGPIKPRTPFPHAQQSFFDRSWGRSNYNSFQFLLDRKFSNDLAYQVSYTWSKSIDIGASGWYGVEGFRVQDPYNPFADRGVSGFDLTHVLAMNYVWQLPLGPGQEFNPSNKVASAIIGNWQFNGIVSIRSGQPYNFRINGDLANTGNTGGYLRPLLVGDPELSNPTPTRWFNTDAYVLPPVIPGTTIRSYGNVGRHPPYARSDGVANFDLSIFRQFPFGEGKRVDFRVEFFNAFNSPVFNLPQGNFSSTNFGVVTSTQQSITERQIQLGVKIIF